MEWWGITGSWRLTSAEVEADVRKAVQNVIRSGDGIVAGGALNVDYFATDEALVCCPSGNKIKIIIPTPLKVYAAHYRQRANEGVISQEQAAALIRQLEKVMQVGSLTEMHFDVCDQDTYYARNTEIINASTALLAFQVNGSSGVQDAVDKARGRNMKVIFKAYNL